MSADAKRRQFRALAEDAAGHELERYTDQCLVWEEPDGSTLYVAGGRWDAEAGLYTKEEPELGKVVRLQPAQVEPARWLLWWLQERFEGRPRDFLTLQLMGDRGAAKTHLAVDALLLLTLEAPKLGIQQSIGWMTSKSFEERDELDRELRAIAPTQWYRYNEERKRYTFATGGTISNLSADDPENLKRGRVDWLLLNEIQKLGKRSYLNGIARLKDKGGLSVVTGNWPTSKSGEWLYELDEKRLEAQREGRRYPVKLCRMASSGNLSLDTGTADQVDTIIRDLDPRLAATDLDGLPMPVTDRAYWEWYKPKNLIRRPDCFLANTIRDITREVTAGRTFRRAGFDFVIGCDFQKYGGMWAIVHKIFGTLDAPILWAVDEVEIEGTEEDLIAELIELGYTPENSLIVGDGSGRWQDGEHIPGRTSFKVFKQNRYIAVGPVPQKDENHRPKNPKFDDRARLHNWLLKHGLYNVDPVGAPVLGEAFAKCEIKAGTYGQGRPCVPWSHPTDGGGYVAMWLYGEKVRKIPTGGSKRLYMALPSLMAERYRPADTPARPARKN